MADLICPQGRHPVSEDTASRGQDGALLCPIHFDLLSTSSAAPGPEPEVGGGHASPPEPRFVAVELRMDGRVGVTPIRVRSGGRVLLGRQPELSPHADFFREYITVSRRHATLSVDDDGVARIRDEFSTNGVRVAGEMLEAGAERRLHDGDLVQLCGDLAGRVRYLEVEDD